MHNFFKFRKFSSLFYTVLLNLQFKDILEVFFLIIIYFELKVPIKLFLYSNIDNHLLALVLSVFFSFVITWFTHKLFSFFTRGLDNIYVIDGFIILYSTILERAIHYNENNGAIVLYANIFSTMPRLGHEMEVRIMNRMTKLGRRAEMLRSQVRVFESISSAMDRDRSDPRHGGLHDAFLSYNRSLETQINFLTNEEEGLFYLITRGGLI